MDGSNKCATTSSEGLWKRPTDRATVPKALNKQFQERLD